MDFELPPYRSPRLLAKIVTAAFVVYAAFSAVSAVLLWDALATANALAAGQVADAELLDLERRGQQLQHLGYGMTALCAITFCFWTHRVATNARAFGAFTTTSPGMAVGYHFIPILNLWRPYSALSEVWNGSDPEMRDGQIAYRTSGLMLTWWIVWVLTGVGGTVVRNSDVDSPEDWITAIKLGFVSLGIESAALVLAVMVVWNLTRRQEARAALVAPARVL